ncbi:hypothetical protein QJS10_CPA03g00308 [Acorus calamus]|uniref:AB hydrolase-1 domain-containing protein n=1 Tax=Acorus calamus TaxID=4465 RepID=A0AAV9F6T1_ACOCL|nr:hypothetical protein QJS10_CPA03g00308 [Acorus calamus]
MVNLVSIQEPLIHWLIKRAGLRQQMVEIEPGTVMGFWVPNTNSNKPAVVMVHGFAAEGVVTWQFQVGSLTRDYAVYVPDLLFFGKSYTTRSERSPGFQAKCLGMALDLLGVRRCTLVGFSYGGMVSFDLAEARPDLVNSLVVSGSVVAGMTGSVSRPMLDRLGLSSDRELLLPSNLQGLKTLFYVAVHRKFWFPDRMFRDYLEVMFSNRKEKEELLEYLSSTGKGVEDIPKFQQRIVLLWGEEDQIFNMEVAKNLREQLGETAILRAIKRGGHLVHLERPCAYTKCLKESLAFLLAQDINGHPSNI